jgi:hypothetical protein
MGKSEFLKHDWLPAAANCRWVSRVRSNWICPERKKWRSPPYKRRLLLVIDEAQVLAGGGPFL